MKILNIILVSSLLFSSCSLLEKSKAHEQMYLELSKDGYPIELKELKGKLDQFLSGSNQFDSESQMIILNSSGIRMSEAQDKIKEDLNDGFTYNNKLYESTPDIGWDMLKGNLDGIKDKLFLAKYHLIEDSAKKFIFVKDDRFYVGESISKKLSKLSIFQIVKVVKPQNINLDWLNILKKKGSFLSFSEGVVELESSMNYKVQDRASELELYFKFLPEEAKKKQALLLKK